MKAAVATGRDQLRDEQRRALRALLLRPLLTSEPATAEVLQLVRRHAEHLRAWLVRNVDWSLTVDTDVARLRKLPADTGDTHRPAVDSRDGTPFTRRRYVLLCLALSALERSERQTTLGRLAEEVGRLFHADPAFTEVGLAWDLGTQEGRRDLVFAIRFLLELGVLVRVEGDEQQFLRDQGDVLYGVRRSALALMLASRRPPSMFDGESTDARLRYLIEEPAPESDEARNRRLRVSLTRRLLDDPILYFDSLSPEELAYLTSQRAHLCRQIEDATGLLAEIRAEGIALVDEGGRLTDLGIPEDGTEGHLALLVAEFLAGRARSQPAGVVPRAALVAHVAALIREHGAHWRRDVRESGAEESLTDQTVDRLVALGLARGTPEGVVPLPAVGRYALARPQPEPASSASSSLFPDLAPTVPAPRRPRTRR